MIQQPVSKQREWRLLAGSLLPAFDLLRRNDPLRLAGATAFFTTFALPPIVFILARLFGLFTGPKVIGRGLIENIGNNLGPEGAQQVRQVIRSIRGFSDSWWVIVPGFLFLIFVATTLFIVIKNSLEQIWEIKTEHAGIASGLLTRLKSMAVILLVGILFLAELLFKGLETLSGDYIDNIFGGGSIYFRLIFSEVTAALIIAVWFVMLFRYLTNTRPAWRAAISGGLLTGLLFIAGRAILRALLLNSNVGTLYGPSGSLVLVLLFVFYTSFIMYYGGCFVRVYGERRGVGLG